MRLTLLGTGTSHGVPVVGCSCSVCTSEDQLNKRTRYSALVDVNSSNFLIDASTELRIQALSHGVRRVDAVLFTHYHADHVGGVDDLKAFNAVLGGPVPCFGNAQTEASLRERFAFAFVGTPWVGTIPHITFQVVDAPFDIFGVRVTPVELQHGKIVATGWRIGRAAYLTDCNGIPPPSMDLLRELDLLVIDGLRPRPHPTHFSIPEAVAIARELRPRRTLLTHLTHDVDHATVSQELPPGIELGYDGQVVEVADD